MKIGFFDIESSSLDAEYGQLLCCVVGEYQSESPEKPKMETLTLQNFQHERWNDTGLAISIREVLETYDLVISYNGARFDVPFVNTRLIEANERGMVLRRHKDLLYTMRGKYRLGSNRLARVTQFLFGETQKTSIDPKTWRQAICGKRLSYDYIIDHCQRDVEELARVWHKVKDVAGVIR